MITTAIAVGSDGSVVLGSGPTYGILLAILFSHGIVCSAATNVLARLNLFYVLVNGQFLSCHTIVYPYLTCFIPLVGATIAAIISLYVCSGDQKVSTQDAFTLFENNTGWSNSKSLTIAYNCTVFKY